MGSSPTFAIVALLAAVLEVSCSKPPVRWSASLPLSLSGGALSATVGTKDTFTITGGVAPYSVSLTGLGSIARPDGLTIQYQRPWTTGSAQLTVTDFLGLSVNLPIVLTAGAVQLGSGAEPGNITMARDAAGNSYVMGSSQAAMGGLFYGNPGIQYLYLAKIDATGTVSWIVQLGAGTFSTTSATQLMVSATGSCWVLGTTDGLLPGTLSGIHGSLDSFVAAIAADGSLSWLTQFGSGAGTSTNPSQMSSDAGGNLYVTGVTSGSLGGTQWGAPGILDQFVLKLSSSGTVGWKSQLGGGTSSNTWLQQTLWDASANSYLLGRTEGNLGGIISGTHGSQDFSVAKFSATGALLWVNQWGGGAASTTKGDGIALDGLGRPVVIADTTGAGGTLWGAHGTQDTLVAQFSTAGVLNWITQLGGGPGNTISPWVPMSSMASIPLAVDGANNVYIAGVTNTDLTVYPGAIQLGSRGIQQDAFVARISSAGAVSWLDQAGSGNYVAPSSLQLSGGNVYMGGVVYGNLGGAQLGAATLGSQEVFILDVTTAGALKWVDQIGGGGISNSFFAQMLLDSSGNTFLAGHSSGLLGGTNYGTHGALDSFLVKVGSSGAGVWVFQLGGGGSSQTTSTLFLQDASGNTYIAGQATRKLIGYLNGPDNFANSFVTKVNPAGLMQ